MPEANWYPESECYASGVIEMIDGIREVSFLPASCHMLMTKWVIAFVRTAGSAEQW